MTRIYQSTPLAVSQKILLDTTASHHLAVVLRAKPCEWITLFNGQNGEFRAQITKIHKKNVEVNIQEFIQREVESPLTLHLAQGISRGEKMDFTIQKAVELGVKKIFPLFTERCNVKLDKERSEKKLKHWQSIIISACEQSGRNRVPEIAMPTRLEPALKGFDQKWQFILSPHEGKKLKDFKIASSDTILLAVGPEGGFSEEELQTFIAHGFQPIQLGPRILRTETAGMTAIAALQTLFGDMA